MPCTVKCSTCTFERGASNILQDAVGQDLTRGTVCSLHAELPKRWHQLIVAQCAYFVLGGFLNAALFALKLMSLVAFREALSNVMQKGIDGRLFTWFNCHCFVPLLGLGIAAVSNITIEWQASVGAACDFITLDPWTLNPKP